MDSKIMALTIGGELLRPHIPPAVPLKERLEFTFRYVREHADELLWMTDARDEDLQFRCAVAGVLLSLKPEEEQEKQTLIHSMKALQIMSRLLSGQSSGVALQQIQELRTEGEILPLLPWWKDSAAVKDQAPAVNEQEKA